jgi:hypothetical protein
LSNDPEQIRNSTQALVQKFFEEQKGEDLADKREKKLRKKQE